MGFTMLSYNKSWILPFLLICIRVFGALFSPIMDCDETYNYWEPLHRLMYGFGFQTWEYAPKFGLRSYLYLYVHALFGWSFSLFFSKKSIFYLVRIFLSMTSAYLETRFSYRTHAPKLTLWFFIWSPGAFQASAAFLPSSFVMVCLLWILSRPFTTASVVVGIGTASLLGWPFAALLGLPLGLYLMISDRLKFLTTMAFTFFMISLPMVLIDSYMYGRWHFAPLNLIQYNLLENKSSLYGVESILFYIKNLFLNWSIAFPCALISWVAFMNRHVIWSTTVILWFVVFLVQPHKEERFLFPIYPFMAWGSSELIRRIPSTLFRRSLCLVFFLISLFRIAGLVHYYAAPLHLDLTSTQGLVCLGPDWYYFPGHFFVPPIARLGFFPIDAGELPDLYDEAPLPLATRKDVEFNGMNRNNPDRFKKISECNFFIGSFPPVNSTALQCVSMLDAAHTSTLNRVLYHPFKKYQTWRPYCLFENKS